MGPRGGREMAIRGNPWTRRFRQISVAGLLLAASFSGCDGKPPALEPTATSAPSQAEVVPSQPQTPPNPRLHQSFAEATRAEPPADGQRPPDLTLTGKSVGKLYTEVVRL